MMFSKHVQLGVTFCLLAGIGSPSALAQCTTGAIHVTESALSTGTGASWSDPAPLQKALTIAQSGDMIWVARGDYSPSVPTGPTGTFQIPLGVSLFGGFSQVETCLEQRALMTPLGTNLSGSFTQYSVVTALGGSTVDPITLDGFRIIQGEGTNQGSNGYGGGLRIELGSGNTVAPVVNVTNCDFFSNRSDYGGAISVREGATLRMKSTNIEMNQSTFDGGGVYVQAATCLSFNVTWIANAGIRDGGALHVRENADLYPSLFGNNLFYFNGDGGGLNGRGGAAFIAGTPGIPGKAVFGNCTFGENVAAAGMGQSMFIEPSNYGSPSATIMNSILWNYGTTASNPDLVGSAIRIALSDVRFPDLSGSLGNIRLDPLFVDDGSGTGTSFLFSLTAGSPCINTGGTPGLLRDILDLDLDLDFTEPLPLDITGLARIQSGAVDMGAYEQ